MSLFRRYLGFAAFSVVLAAAPALCANLLVDDFTDLTASHVSGWRNQSPEQMTITAVSGGYAFDNSANTYSGEYLYDFGGSKPPVFTISFVVKSMDTPGSAGAFFCRQEGSLSGYFMTIYNSNHIAVFKLTNGSSGDAIFYEMSFDLKSADNKLAVSKSGSTFNIFANDAFVGQFTDAAPYNSGNLSFLLDPGKNAVFGQVSVTDAFTEATKRSEFSDKFDDPGLKYWKALTAGDVAPVVGVADGKLKMKTEEGGAAWRYIDIDLAAFEATVEVSHLSGKSESPYGIILLGANANTQATNFAILGSGKYTVWTAPNTTYTPLPSNKILGAGPGGAIFTDTIEIKKKANSPNYEFYVNGELLMNSTDVNFKIAGIGLFAYGGVEVAFDNFYVKETSPPTSIWRDSGKRISSKPTVSAKNAPQAFYDLRGRKRYTLTAGQSSNRATIRRAAGVYVNENGKEIHVKGRR